LVLVALDLIASKPKFTNQFLYISSSNANPINAHTNSDTCHQSIPSPNTFIFKLIIVLGNNKHLYSMVEINTQNNTTLCLVIDLKGMINLKI
jgi:hypothetical protein